MVCYEVVRARGHENIRATHRTTLEITREDHLSTRGDCIIGVSADKGVSDLSVGFKKCLKASDTILVIVFEARGFRDCVLAEGHPDLILTDKNKLIIRKSTYIDPATLCVRANKAAFDLKRELIHVLRDPNTTLLMHLYALRLNEITSVNAHSRGVL